MKASQPSLSSLDEDGALAEVRSVRLTVSLAVTASLLVAALYAAVQQLVSWPSVAFLTAYIVLGMGLLTRVDMRVPQGDGAHRLVFYQALFHLGLLGIVLVGVGQSQSIGFMVMSLVVMWDMPFFNQMQARIVAAWAALLLIVYPIYMTTLAISPQVLAVHIAGAATVLALLKVGDHGRKLRHWQLEIRHQLNGELQQLQRLEKHEDLTGLLNRRYMQELLELETVRCGRSGHSFGLALLDLDHFKSINDSHGHQIGDEVLKAFANILTEVAKDQPAYAARWGGEEFLILVPEVTAHDLAARMTMLQGLTRQTNWSELAPGLSVSCSGGFGIHQQGESVSDLIRRVDDALYLAKSRGRDRLVPASDVELGHWEVERLQQAAPGLNKTRHPMRTSAKGSSGPTLGSASKAFDAGALTHRIRIIRLILVFNLIWLSLIWSVGVPLKVIDQNTAVPVSWALVMGVVIGTGIPNLLSLAGWTPRSKDPILVPQILWALTLLASGYVISPLARPVLLQWMCHVMATASTAVSAKRNKLIGATALMLVSAILVYLQVTRPDGSDSRSDIVTLLSAAGILALANRRSTSLARLREGIAAESLELASTSQKVIEAISHDGLTGLVNRRYAMDALQTEATRQDNQGGAFCVALIDLDHFKRVNDNHGHMVGDEVLKSFSVLAPTLLRKIDVVARWGGEEFLVLLRDASSIRDAVIAMDRVRAELEMQVVSANEPGLRVTMSAGIVKRECGESLESLLGRADEALYRAKRNGRNQIALLDKDAEIPKRVSAPASIQAPGLTTRLNSLF